MATNQETRCEYCNQLEEEHHPNHKHAVQACPEILLVIDGHLRMQSKEKRAELTSLFQQGYEDGFNRRKLSDDPTYILGWRKGDANADCVENNI